MDFPTSTPPTRPPEPIRPVSPSPAPSVQPVASVTSAVPTVVVEPSRRWLGWVIGGAVALAILGGGYFAYSQGYLKKIGLAPDTSNSAAVINGSTNNNRSTGLNGNRAVNTGSVISNSSTTASTNSQPETSNANSSTNSSASTTSLDGRSVTEQYGLATCYINKHPDILQSMPQNDLNDSLKDYVSASPKDMGCDVYTMADIEAARPLLTIDADGDGMVLVSERFFGTSDQKKDTDGDGFDDFTEVSNGYNPNGPGKMI